MSPTVATFGNYRIEVRSREHGLPHVHVIGPDAEAVFILEPVRVKHQGNFSDRAVRQLTDFLIPREEMLLKTWKEFNP